jgi:hypothetical protein
MKNGTSRETCTAWRTFHNEAPDDRKRRDERSALHRRDGVQPDGRRNEAEGETGNAGHYGAHESSNDKYQ